VRNTSRSGLRMFKLLRLGLRPQLRSVHSTKRGPKSVHRSRSLPAVRTPLAEALGRVLRETICAPEDLPPVDRSTRDGYAIRADDASETFSVVDTIHAADWKPPPAQARRRPCSWQPARRCRATACGW